MEKLFLFLSQAPVSTKGDLIMYAKNENGILIFPPQNKDNILNYNQNSSLLETDGYIDYSDTEMAFYNSGSGYSFDENNRIVDITQTDEYKAKIDATEKAEKIRDLQLQISELDRKRIRAMCEPSIKDETTGQTWLEYYTLQIKELREKINNLI